MANNELDRNARKRPDWEQMMNRILTSLPILLFASVLPIQSAVGLGEDILALALKGVRPQDNARVCREDSVGADALFFLRC